MSLISIIIPVYNVEEFITDCLESVIDEKYSDLVEIIIVNDCSTDRSKEIIMKKIKSKRNFSLINNVTNLGLSSSRNIGLKESKSDFVLFLDSDDVINLSSVLSLVRVVIDYNLDLLVFRYSRFISLNNLVMPFQTFDFSEKNVFNGPDALYKLLKSNKYDPVAWNKIYSRKIIVDNEMEFFPGIFAEDELWTPKVFLASNRVGLASIIAYFYRINPSSITENLSNNHRIKRQKDIVRVVEFNTKLAELVKSEGLKSELLDRSARSLMFAYTLSPETFTLKKWKPLMISRRFLTILKSLLFLISTKAFIYLKHSRQDYDKNKIS
jgi:glycosyltransferase involved in cell wall biosynthesis